MIGLLQRVSQARVVVDGQCIATIEAGLLVLVGIERDDTKAKAERLLERVLAYRVFEDEAGKMNRSLADLGAGLLLVPQFTLAANTRNGLRASFAHAAPPEQAKALFEHLVEQAAQRHAHVAYGRFGADMAVSLTNEGPVTFWLQV